MLKIKQGKPLPNFFICLIMDLIGCASFVIPGFGEFSDVIWAPVSAFIFYKLFGGKIGLFGGAIDFIEEILPFTDFIPTFTIAWFVKSAMMPKIDIPKTAVSTGNKN